MMRPVSARLPKFYLALAAGGALGGALVALAAPLAFSDYFEHPLVLWRGRMRGATAVPSLDAGAAGEAEPDLANFHNPRWMDRAAGDALVVSDFEAHRLVEIAPA